MLTCKAVKVRAYASVANLGPGFDILAMAITSFYDEVEAVICKNNETEIYVKEISGPYSSNIPTDERNTAVAAAKEFLSRIGKRAIIRLRLWKGVPIGKGLGSSGATAAATVVGLNEILEPKISYNELIEIAAEGEKVAAGSPHPDNVAASILGGLVLIYQRKPLRAIKLPLRVNPKIILAIPKIMLVKEKTRIARSLLPKQVPLEKVVYNSGKLGALITGFLEGNIDLAGSGMYDEIVEPARAPLVPVYFQLKKKLLNLGVSGICVCGAGPSIMVMLKPGYEKVDDVKKTIRWEYRRHGINVEIIEANIAPGAQVLQP